MRYQNHQLAIAAKHMTPCIKLNTENLPMKGRFEALETLCCRLCRCATCQKHVSRSMKHMSRMLPGFVPLPGPSEAEVEGPK